jgi:hypothetical protein
MYVRSKTEYYHRTEVFFYLSFPLVSTYVYLFRAQASSFSVIYLFHNRVMGNRHECRTESALHRESTVATVGQVVSHLSHINSKELWPGNCHVLAPRLRMN